MATFADGHVDKGLHNNAHKGGLRLKEVFFAKLAQRNHKFFDSGEYFSLKQGIKMPDLLPGGAPPHACPVKKEPTVAAPRHYRKLDERSSMSGEQEQLNRLFQHQVSCSDY